MHVLFRLDQDNPHYHHKGHLTHRLFLQHRQLFHSPQLATLIALLLHQSPEMSPILLLTAPNDLGL